ncbi:hypothetical protein [Ferruginibacter sp. SUN106]|uniref:hypothetical protein n=1 Tax=Ferruginibacter sp. SUN106 TaxID=2978348 RepID=UPI003D367BED
MKLPAGIAIAFVCFTMFTASAQITPAKAKADTLKTKPFKLTDEYDFFSKTSDVKKNDSASFINSNDFLAALDSFLDVSLSWKAQRNNTDVFVTTASPLFNADHYDGFIIAPRQAKILHLNITGSLFSSNTFSPAYVPFYLQVKSGKTVYLNELEQGKKTINISLNSTDTVAIVFVAHPPENDKAHFHCEWSIGDTAAYSYAGQKPEIVFDKMLELAPNQFTNIRNDKFGEPDNIEYPTGLFAPLPAERIAFNTHVTQYTGKKLPTGKAADIINAEWNKKITDWLKGYNVTDVKKTETGDRKLNTDTEITTYTKKNAQGKVLFIIKVFKEQVEEAGNEADVVFWNTGVSIY